MRRITHRTRTARAVVLAVAEAATMESRLFFCVCLTIMAAVAQAQEITDRAEGMASSTVSLSLCACACVFMLSFSVQLVYDLRFAMAAGPANQAFIGLLELEFDLNQLERD
ncbi:hypothetical protein L1887_25611 [Cichorium endivia]|nr:hypothetical protein L1887_25611 [Cichorium endivia]